MYPLLASLMAVLVLAAPVRSQVDAQEQARLTKFKGVFVYNFIEYVTWPEEKTSGDFVIGILGDVEAAPVLAQIAPRRDVDGREVAVRTFDEPGPELAACHVLCVGPPADEQLAQIGEQLAGKHVLIIGDGSGLAQRGAAIGFVLVQGTLKFEICQKSLAHAGLVMDSQLLKLGILVE